MKFEENLQALEALVKKMESGKLSLDETLEHFEAGKKLVDACQKDLASIRLRIEKVTQSGAVEKFEP